MDVNGMLDDLLDLDQELTPKELEIVESLDRWRTEGGWFTSKQVVLIGDLYERRC